MPEGARLVNRAPHGREKSRRRSNVASDRSMSGEVAPGPNPRQLAATWARTGKAKFAQDYGGDGLQLYALALVARRERASARTR